MVRCEVAGQVNMKSFLMGSPDIKIGLNEDLTIGKEEKRRGEVSWVQVPVVLKENFLVAIFLLINQK